MPNDLTTVTAASRALAEATTIDEMRDVHAFAEAMRSGARTRGLGIEAENEAAELIFRTERKLGAELRRMADAGERKTDAGPRHQVAPSLDDLGVTTRQSWTWQQLATIPDDAFEEVVAEARSLPDQRLSRVDFIRAWFGRQPKAKVGHSDRADTDEWTAAWKRVVVSLADLGEKLDHGWPVVTDRTRRGWQEINSEIDSAGRTLLYFQKRVRAHLKAMEE